MKSAPKFPNIILIVMDAGRADHLSCYGYERATTPHLDRIAAEGTLFENAMSAAVWTVPSHASLFTGMYLSGHGLRGRNLKLRKDLPTMASFLTTHGYDTLALTANALIGQATGLARGFAELKDVRNVFQGEHLLGWQKKANALYRRLYYGRSPHQSSWYDSGAWRLNYDMKRWIRQKKREGDERPFFIFANYMEPHLRYDPPSVFRQKFLTIAQEKRWQQVNQNAWKFMSGEVQMTDEDWDILTRLYDAELAYLDSRLGQLYQFLQQNQLLDKTLLIITSDHGENLGDHQMMDHQYCVYETLTRVPLIVRYPAKFKAGLRSKTLVQSVDLLPTFAELLSAQDDPSLDRVQGQSLLAAERSDFAVTEYLAPQLHSFRREGVEFDPRFSRQLRALRTERYKYIKSSEGADELYDLKVDPDERHNLIEVERETAVFLANKLQQWVEQHTIEAEDETRLDEAVISRLEALGYI
ncbi:MAG: sulfatase-like hydrolase/transferase [Chloroflexi bacterium]|nr:sulfatase-like hydrolase/transferase [Chloroflexota bacterium]